MGKNIDKITNAATQLVHGCAHISGDGRLYYYKGGEYVGISVPSSASSVRS